MSAQHEAAYGDEHDPDCPLCGIAPQHFTECCGAAWDDFCKPWCVNARQDMCRDCGQAHAEPGGCSPTCDICGDGDEYILGGTNQADWNGETSNHLTCEVTCDICGEPDDGRDFGHEPDWNGETGNHLTCEVTPMA